LLEETELPARVVDAPDEEDPHAVTPTARALVRMHEARARRTDKDVVISGDS
jgi:hypothetical protein